MQKGNKIYKKCFLWLKENENIHYLMRIAFLVFAIVYVCLEFENKWQPFLNKYIVTPYLNISTDWGVALLILCTLATIVWGINIWTNKTRISWRRNIPIIVIILFLYIYFRFFCNSYAFLPYEWCIKFVDWGALLFTLFEIELVVTEIVCRSISKKNESNFLYDGAIEQKEQDILDYSDKAIKAAEDLKRFDVSEHSWSVGVTGKWGSGKTSYINLILELLLFLLL